MARKIVIVPDKFKGTLTAAAAARAMSLGWRKRYPRDVTCLLPMSDGGDGFGAILGQFCDATKRVVKTVNAAHQPVNVPWWCVGSTSTAIIESSRVIGLAMLPAGKFHPFELDTYGLGKVIRASERQGARHCIVGIGGSATNDGGFGMAKALGWHFLDRQGRPLAHWTDLHLLASIKAPERPCKFAEVTVAVDVSNPLLGPRGASRIYGPQKGLRARDFAQAEVCLKRLATVARQELGKDFSSEPGAGAAGGLGFGLRVFLGACFASGFDLFARFSQLETHLRSADLVLTGEGALDRSTLMGKGVGQIARLCKTFGVPCLALSGSVTSEAKAGKLFERATGLTDITSLAKAKRSPAFWLKKLTEEAAAAFGGDSTS
jgi:glycerate kinase